MIDVRSFPGAQVVTMIADGGYFPVLAVMPDDSVAAVLRMGAGHLGLAGRLDVVRSTDGGLTWTAPVTIADSDADDRNPAFGYHDGALICAYHIQRNYDADGQYGSFGKPLDTMLTRSFDGGRTWETPYLLSYAPINGASPYGKIVALPDGTLLLPIYDWPREEDEEGAGHTFSANILRSHDNGATWDDPSLIAGKFNETGLVLLPDGKLVAAIRTGFPGVPDHVWLTTSDDAGYTWADPWQVTEHNEHPADLTLLSDGSVLMVYGRRHEPFGVRGKVLRGGEWSDELVFADDAFCSDCGYPSSVRLSDGRMITAYYATAIADSYDPSGCQAKAVVYHEDDLLKAVG
jgi:hypothetical protein